MPEAAGDLELRVPLPGVPFLITETMASSSETRRSIGLNNKYRRAGDSLADKQALFHAQAHERPPATHVLRA